LFATLDAERLEDGGDRTSESFQAAARRAQAAQRVLALIEARQAQQAAQRAVLRATDEKKKAELAKKLPAADEALAKAEAEAASPEFARRKIATYPATSSGRRLALARWISDAQNPLTARVAVNHVWMRHFGRAIVPSAFDFGTQGHRPSHPALLDALALEFME